MPDDDTTPAARPVTSRRSFLAVGGTAVGGTALVASLGRAGKNPDALDRLAERFAPASVTEDSLGTTVVVRRPSDQCFITLAYFNTKVDYTTSPPSLVKKVRNVGSSLLVYFGDFEFQAPMHVAEEAYPLVSSSLDDSAQQTGYTSGNKNGALTPVPAKTAPVDAPPKVAARASGGSRLVFAIPDDRLPMPLDTAHLLNWIGLPLTVHKNAVPPFHPASARSRVPAGIGKPSEPSGFETAIELPYNLIISPPATPTYGVVGSFPPQTVFVNALAPVTHDGWTELWHTRLAARVFKQTGNFGTYAIDETDRSLRTVRAIWCLDKPFQGDLDAYTSDNHIADDGDPGFRTSLTYDDRYDIVRLSSDFDPSSKGPFRRKKAGDPAAAFGFVPSPATVERLMLTSLGGWLDCDAHWDLPASPKSGHFNTSLLSWRHRAVQGRDTYVRVVRKGYLFPWGHRASLVTVTERQFTPEAGSVGAYLRQKTFIVVTAPVETYGGSGDYAPFGGRHIPFKSVESLTLVTPDLASPTRYVTTKVHGKHIQENPESVFEPVLGPADPFLFHFRGTDWAGDPIDFRSPVLWVDDTIAYGTNDSSTLMDHVYTNWRADYPTVALRGQRVSVANPKRAGDTQVVAASFELGVDRPDTTNAALLIGASQPVFYPAMHSVAVDLPEAKVASGNGVGTTTMQFGDHYIHHGFGSNPGGIFLERVQTATRHKITFNSAKAGGSITPNLGVDGLSRAIGPVSGNTPSDIAALVAGQFNPASVFKGVDAKLLGGLELSSILQNVTFDEDDTAKALSMTSVEKSGPHRVITTLDWHPTIKDGGPDASTIVFHPVGDDLADSMDLHALIVTDLTNAANSHSIVNGQIRDFELHLFGSGDEYFILIPFDSLTFRAQSGQKTDVDVQVGADGVQFQGALSFVQDLATLLNFDGSGLTINTAGSAITATLTLAIPTLTFGIFSLANLAFSAGVAIPYNGDPVRFTFAFCSAENPFQLTIMVFTGGGFVEIGIGADGIEMLAFSFDFGLGFSIDIGVASGQISLTGGIYYEGDKQADGSQSVDLTAWVKAAGGVSALGVVSVSVELYLGLGYQSDGPGTAKLVGDAELTISVHILFFGFSIGIGMHEEFDVSEPAGQVAHHAEKHHAIAPADAEPPKQPTVNTFDTTMTHPNWESYCTSFALIGEGV